MEDIILKQDDNEEEKIAKLFIEKNWEIINKTIYYMIQQKIQIKK